MWRSEVPCLMRLNLVFMAETDFGKNSREAYKKQFKDEDPGIDSAYLAGEDQPDPKGLTKKQVKELQRKYAEHAARYKKPAAGYKNGDHHEGPTEGKVDPAKVTHDPKTEEVIGGGIYSRDVPASDAERCSNAYRWVEDTFWPKNPNPEPAGTDLDANWGKLQRLEKGGFDVGQRLPKDERSGWACIDLAEFLAFLLRALGYKVQYKNIVPSTMDDETDGTSFFIVQTAAMDVWFDGKWNLFDPFESFSEADGGLEAYTKKKGNLGCDGEPDARKTPYHDAHVYRWEKPTYLPVKERWKAPGYWQKPADVDKTMKKKGWTLVGTLREAGIGFMTTDERIRLGLAFGSAFCGWNEESERLDSLEGAAHHAYGRPQGAEMRPESLTPAHDEQITFNAYRSGHYRLELVISNRSYDSVRSNVAIYPSSSPYLRVALGRRRRVTVNLHGRTSLRISVPVTVTSVAKPPQGPIRDLRCEVKRRTVVLAWTPVVGAIGYKVFRHTRPLIQIQQLRPSRMVAEPNASAYEDRPMQGGLLYYAVLAVGRGGRVSELDWEYGSVGCVDLRRRRG